MDLICTHCKQKTIDIMQCKKCLVVYCKKCELYCGDCDISVCKKCEDNIQCATCKEIICPQCPYISVKVYVNRSIEYYRYCIKNGCCIEHMCDEIEYNSKYENKRVIKRFVDYIIKQKSQLLYMPGSKGYNEAKSDFESQVEKTDD